MKLKANGKLKITYLGKISIDVHPDFCKYYSWLYKRETWNTQKINLPKHGAHINIVNPKIHGKLDLSRFAHLNGKEIEFEYSIEGNFGGFTKGFLNFWLDVKCEEAEIIAKDLGVYKEEEGFSAFHLTIFNTKNT